jgi:hypothetical protein
VRKLIRFTASAFILTTALAIATALPASASTITYVFAPSSSATFDDGNIESFAGSFTVDTTNNSLASTITVTGAAPEGQSYTAGETVAQQEVVLTGFNGSLILFLNTQFGLSPITAVTGESFTGDPFIDIIHTQLTLLVAVPEISTWAMMILGFSGLGFIASRQRNRQMAAA